MIKNFIFYLLFTFNLSVSYALVVKEVTIVDEGGSPSVSFSFDESFFLEPDQEDDETLLIEFPEDTKWQGPLSQDSNLGLSYTYIPYQDGSGDLVIKKEGRLAAGKLIQTNSNQYTLPFYAQNMPQKKAPLTSEEPPPLPSPPVNNTTPLGITKILAGAKNQNTRLVFALTRPTKFIVKENDDFSKVYVIPTEITQWKLAPASNQSFGSFKGYKLVQLKDDVAIELAVTPGTRIVQAALIDEKTSEPKLVLDLGHKSFVPTISRQANSERINDVYNSMKDQNNSLLSRGDSFSVFSEDHLVKSMNILVQNNDTIIRLSTTGVKNFDVQENSQTNELTILLPKMIWDHVNVTEQKAGLVEEFRVDQKDPNHTKLIFKLQKGTSIIGKKSFGREDDGRFVVYLNQREKKTPTWLIDASTADLSYYDDLEKEENETSRLVYRGGIRPYTNVGDGFYVGLKASSLAGQQKSHSSTTPYATNLFPSTFGGGAHVFAGYGVNFDKIYAGGEINVGLYGGESKTTYHINLTDSNASSSVGATWGATGRLGYYVSPTTLFYGRLGAVSSSFKYSGSSAASGEIVFPGKYTRTSRSGFLYGVGLESALNDHITVRMEGAQINYQPFYYRSGTNYKKDRPLLNEINLGVGYKLSPMSGPAMEDAYEESVGTGFYFGADGGLSTLLNTRHVKGVSGTNAATTYDGDGSTVDPSWGLFAGYSYHMDRFFMAGEVQLALTKPVISESIINNGVTTESYSNTLRWLWALTARPGYIFNHGTIGYGRIGIIGGSFSHSAQHSGAQRTLTTGGSSKAYGLGIRLGAGLETFINPHLSLRSEYILDYLPGIKIRDKTNGAIKEETSMINNEFKLGLSWHLDP